MLRLYQIVSALLIVAGWGLAFYYRNEILRLERDAQILASERDNLRRLSWKHEKKSESEHASEIAPRLNVPSANPSSNAVGVDIAKGFLAMMNNPRSLALYDNVYRAQVKRNYGDLFRKLQLPEDQLQSLQDLLVKRQNVSSDAILSAINQGFNPLQDKETFAKLQSAASTEVDVEVRGLLGSAQFREYSEYFSTEPQRNVVNQLRQALDYTSHPLSESQSAELIQVLKENKPSTSMPTATAPVVLNDQVMASAKSFLTEQQYAEIKALRLEQESGNELVEIMNHAPDKSGVPLQGSSARPAK